MSMKTSACGFLAKLHYTQSNILFSLYRQFYTILLNPDFFDFSISSRITVTQEQNCIVDEDS